MYELKKKNGKVFTSKFVGAAPSSYKKRIYRAAVSQSLRNNGVYFNNWTSNKTQKEKKRGSKNSDCVMAALLFSYTE
jgi:hypothetical protein